jgi:hypothetical protein
MVVSVAIKNQSPAAAKVDLSRVICENAVNPPRNKAAVSICFFIFLYNFFLAIIKPKL